MENKYANRPMNHYSQRTRRILVVIFIIVLLLPHLRFLVPLPDYLHFLIGSTSFPVLASIIVGLLNTPLLGMLRYDDKLLDERQISRKHQLYRMGFYIAMILGGVVLLSVFFIDKVFTQNLLSSHGNVLLIIFYLYWVLVVATPFLVVAWIEPDEATQKLADGVEA